MASFGGRTNSFSNRGGRGRMGRGFPPTQYVNNKLVKSDISGLSLLKKLENNPDALKRVQKILDESEEVIPSSFANIVADHDENDSYIKKVHNQENILTLDNRDVKWQDDPWQLLQRYLGTSSYTGGTYKQRAIFEYILKGSESCDIRHFFPTSQTNVFNFSKIIFKQIISIEEWGISPFGEKDCKSPNQSAFKYNFWDYKEAFYKVFLYQNPQRKHTWFIKICPLIYKRSIPNWFFEWWHRYGAEENILPQDYLDLFHKWKEVSPAIIEAGYNKNLCLNFEIIHFFCEFGIPWIYRWEPEVCFSQDNIPFLKRTGYTKFWKKMVRLDITGSIEGQETLDLIKKKIVEYEGQISSKTQREAFNPFDIIERRIVTANMSREEQIEKFMKEAEKAILKKLGPEPENSEEEAQKSENILSDKEMAEFYAKMCPRSFAKGASSGSNSMDVEQAEDSDHSFCEEIKGSKKKTKGKGRRK